MEKTTSKMKISIIGRGSQTKKIKKILKKKKNHFLFIDQIKIIKKMNKSLITLKLYLYVHLIILTINILKNLRKKTYTYSVKNLQLQT